MLGGHRTVAVTGCAKVGSQQGVQPQIRLRAFERARDGEHVPLRIRTDPQA